MSKYSRLLKGPFCRLLLGSQEFDRAAVKDLLSSRRTALFEKYGSEDSRFAHAIGAVFDSIDRFRKKRTNERFVECAEGILNMSDDDWENVRMFYRELRVGESDCVCDALLPLFHMSARSDGKGEFIAPLVDASVRRWCVGSSKHDVELIDGRSGGSIKACLHNISDRYVRLYLSTIAHGKGGNRILTDDEVEQAKIELGANEEYLLVFEDCDDHVMMHRIAHSALVPYMSTVYGVRCHLPKVKK